MTIPADEVLAPLWSQIWVATTSSSAATKDLTTIGLQTLPSIPRANQSLGAQCKYIRIYAVTTDVAVVFADTTGHADDVLFPASGNAGVNLVSGCVPIFASTYQDFMVPNDNTWLGYITASANGIMVVYVSSRPFT